MRWCTPYQIFYTARGAQKISYVLFGSWITGLPLHASPTYVNKDMDLQNVSIVAFLLLNHKWNMQDFLAHFVLLPHETWLFGINKREIWKID